MTAHAFSGSEEAGKRLDRLLSFPDDNDNILSVILNDAGKGLEAWRRMVISELIWERPML